MSASEVACKLGDGDPSLGYCGGPCPPLLFEVVVLADTHAPALLLIPLGDLGILIATSAISKWQLVDQDVDFVDQPKRPRHRVSRSDLLS